MKLKRSLLLVTAGLLALTSCGTNSDSDVRTSETEISNKISLNVTQADLIADITDNVKYLNQDLLYTIDSLEDSDNISVIITLDSVGLADNYNENDKGYDSLSEYATSKYASSAVRSMTAEQEKFAKILLKEGYINEINHTYTTLFNGFSAKTTYGQFKALEAANYGVNVTISEVYSQPEYKITSNSSYEAVTNFVNVYGTGIFDSSNVNYDGENTAVAVLDSGFDIHHTVFQNMPSTPMISRDDVNAVLYESKAYGYHQDIKVQDVYMNSKIPFVYDYADKDPDVAPYDSEHGTHVAGIIGGSDDIITGVAVNTQLVLMKVFGDINNGAIQEDILAALEDAILLGVDAINLSLGTACGFSRSSDNEYINVVYDKIEEAGISLIVAASNDYSSGYGGENGNTNKASNPDSATVGSPGTYESTLSVASISGVKSKYIIDEDGYTFFFNNANNSAGEPYDFYDMLFELLDSTENTIELEYVTVPGVGKKVNYSSIDVKGKIALVKRGDTSFEEKAAVALSQGAIGCIIYNNVAGDVFMNAGNGLGLALCSISKDDGEYLAAKGEGTLVLSKDYLAGPFMSEFSSWGPVSDLSLKPEITAHGGSILSAVPGGGYEEISGTSMACPNLCGVVILVRQALKERYPDITPVEMTIMANQLLMSTGTIILDESANPYSPRKQGAGLGNLEYALDTLAYLSVEGSTKSKVELLDDPKETGVYELVFDINNISNKELKYNLSNYTMTESLSTADPEYVAEKAYMLNPKTAVSISGAGLLNGDTITVNPNGTVRVKYTLTLNESEKKYLRKSFANGMYVEGFAVLDSLNEDGIDLSIPFLAFFGDWTVAPMFDKTFYEVESEAHNGSIDEEDKLKADYYATTPLGTYYYSYIIPLGSYVYEIDENAYDPIPATEEHAAIGYNLETINGITTVYAGLLRNAKKMTTVIKNADTGQIVYEHVKYDEHKAYFSGSIVPGYDLINITALELGLQNNTKYTFTMTAELDYGDGGLSSNLNNTFEFSFYVDYEAPIVTDAEFYSKYDKSLKDYRYYVDVYVYDNHYAQSIRPFTIVDGKLTSLSEYVIPIYGEKGDISKVTVEITDYMDLLQYGLLEDNRFALTNGLGFLVDDYALNQSYSYVTLPGTNTTNISYKSEYVSGGNNGIYTYKQRINVGDELDLSYMLTSDDPSLAADEDVQARYFASLKWESDDENVVKVKNGLIEAVGVGTTYVKCTTMRSDGNITTVSLKVTVRGGTESNTSNKLTDIEFTYFDTLKAFIDGPEISEIGETGDRFFFTEKPYISFYPSEQVQLGYELEPWNLKDYKLIWSSTNEKVASVDENGVVTALKEGSATITLKVEVDGRTSTLMASTRVNVKSEFVIEANTLVAYKGLGGKVEIPDDEGILYIGSFAFSLYTTDYKIEITEDDYDAAKTPSSNDSVTSVIIPGDIKEVQKYAFFNCTALEKVTFLANAEGDSCPIIREYAFKGDEALTDINLEKVQIIGARAFDGCTGLENVDISRVHAIGRQAFKDCTNLKYVDITALRNADEEVFLNCTKLETIDNGRYTNFSEGMFKNSGLTTLVYEADRIPNNCFENCKNLVNVVIANGLVYVGASSFANCGELKEFAFEDNAGTEFIYESAFVNCTKLESVVLPDSEFEFEQNAFDGCVALSNVIFNENTKITNNLGSVFNGCSALSTFIVDSNNNSYKSLNSLLLSKDGTTIILAAPNYQYGDYTIPSGISKVYEGAFSSIASINSLVISEEVNEIGAFAFANCSNLASITLPTANIDIKDKAFMNCEKLSEINNIDSLKNFAPYVFANTAITSLSLSDVSIEKGAFSSIATLTSINVSSDSIIGSYAFAYNKNLVDIVINANEIGAYAFTECTKLNNLEINSVERIEEGAFSGCKSITTINIPSLKYVGAYAFADNILLSNIELSQVEEIGKYAFATTTNEGGNSLTEVVLPDSLTKIGEHAFYASTSLESVVIGSGISEIGVYAFANCFGLVDFITTGSINVISEGAFAEDSLLTTVEINNVKSIEGAAFMNCKALVNIDLSTVETIGMQAFQNCSSLVEVDLQSVIKLDAGAFLSASSLVTVNMPKIEHIDLQALSCIGVTEIVIPSTIKYIAPTAFYFNESQTKFVNIDGEKNCTINSYALIDEGVLYTTSPNGKYQLNAYPTAKPEESYSVLFGTVRIEEYAAYFNQNLKSIVFPDTLKLIGNMSFYGCKFLMTVEFRSTVAPTLEGTVSSLDISYETDSEIYKILNKYFQFNGYYPLYYGQFKDMIGKATKMNIIIPSNKDVVGYDNILYSLYFNIDTLEKSDYVALNQASIDYLNKVVLVPTEVSLSDEMIIQDARTAYNLLTQKDLTVYGYEQEYLDQLYDNLVKAEEAWLKLKMERINKVYEYLIEGIKELGSTYDFAKIADYYSIVKSLEMMDKDDKRYIDTTNVDSFKAGFDKYFKDLNDDIKTITEVGNLPTSSVTKVGLVVAAAAIGITSSLGMVKLLRRRWFI